MAAAVADYRPAAAARRQDQEGRSGRGARRSSSSAPTTSSPRSPQRRRARPGAGRLRRRARRRRASPTAAASSSARASTPSSSTTSSRPGIGFDAPDNEVTIVTADGRAGTCPRATKAAIARAILDMVLSLRSSTAVRVQRLMEPLEPSRHGRRPRGRRRPPASRARIADNIAPRRARSATRCSQHVVVALLAEGHILVEDYPGVGKTALARALVALDRLPVRARAVHRRPAAGRHRRHQRLQPARAALRVPARPDLRQRRARRRDQPRLAEDAVRPARVHAGAPRHRRRPHARARAPVPGLRDAEPGRVRGHLPAARGAARPLHGPALARLPRRRRRGRDARRPRGRRPRARPRSRSPTTPRCSPPRTPRAACTPPRRCATTSSRCCAAPATTTASSSAPSRAPA